MRIKPGWLFSFFMVLLSGCDTNAVYKEITDIKDGAWYVNHTPSYTFTIDDTTATYSIYYNIRNTLSYQYYNLYIRRYLLDARNQPIQSQLDELILFDRKTGKPLGDGLGDLFDHKIRVVSGYRFPRRGNYTIRLRQYMRQNPLPELLSVGISIEKEI